MKHIMKQKFLIVFKFNYLYAKLEQYTKSSSSLIK